jgi:hypothetical protein
MHFHAANDGSKRYILKPSNNIQEKWTKTEGNFQVFFIIIVLSLCLDCVYIDSQRPDVPFFICAIKELKMVGFTHFFCNRNRITLYCIYTYYIRSYTLWLVIYIRLMK